jgi:hypothetical protein
MAMGPGNEAVLPVQILSYDRPQYLGQVLRSLRGQVPHGAPVALFQDGAYNPHSARWKAEPADIAACVALFREVFPWGQVHESLVNLGIAENYRRAEEYCFRQLGATQGLFLEDDLVLSPHYLAAIRQLLALAAADKRIAYVSACGDMWAGLWRQWWGRRRVAHMRENWGFAMTRGAWEDEQEFRGRYLQLLDGVDYSLRDHERIVAFYREQGYQMPVTSQDGARWIACLRLGRVRVSTVACYAQYIGALGEHATQGYFDASGFAATRMAPWPQGQLRAPSEGEIAGWLAAETRRFTGEYRPFY